ncbi:MAG: MerR family transcriptional regulator [Kibdelosporangium sp.]
MSRRPAQASWATGWVARQLGISPITLRTWDTRYDIGPSHREEGRHRRYTADDIERLRLMQRLITGGTRPREAAELARLRTVQISDRVAGANTADLTESLNQAAEGLRLDTMADLLDAFIDSRGVVATWQDVLRPVIRSVAGRSLTDETCRDIEWALAGSISAALDRSLRTNQAHTDSGHPALLVCCPQERHALPLRALAAALHERRVPIVQLGDMVPAEITLTAERRLQPAVVVLWALRQENAARSLARRLHSRRVPLVLAGSGWQDFTTVPAEKTDDLEHAVSLIETLTAKQAHSG